MTGLNKFWQKNILWLIFFAVSFSVIICFVLLPTVNQLRENKALMVSKQNDLDQLDYRLNILQKRTKNIDPFNKILNGVNDLLPDAAQTSAFIIQLEQLANSNSAIISNLSITEPKATAKASGVTKTESIFFSFDLDANYQTIHTVVKSLENFDRFNSIDSINMLSHEDGTISTQIKGKIYYGKQ